MINDKWSINQNPEQKYGLHAMCDFAGSALPTGGAGLGLGFGFTLDRLNVRKKGVWHILQYIFSKGVDSSSKASQIRKSRFLPITLDSSRMDLEFFGVVCKDGLFWLILSLRLVRERRVRRWWSWYWWSSGHIVGLFFYCFLFCLMKYRNASSLLVLARFQSRWMRWTGLDVIVRGKWMRVGTNLDEGEAA